MAEQSSYYEQAELWRDDYHQSPAEEQRRRETIELIPEDVETILDVGCGNGAFLNSLPPHYQTMGIDFSAEALSQVRTRTMQGDIRSLNVADHSFDLVTCLEVLEHLTQDTFRAARAEIERTARKYILISVPNRQRLDLFLVQCPACLCQFNPSYHFRSFGPDDFKNLFRKFTLVTVRESGPMDVRDNLPAPVAAAYRVLLRQPPPPLAVCPQCGHQEGPEPLAVSDVKARISPGKRSFVRVVTSPLRVTGRLFWRPLRCRRWLLALYKAV